MKKVVTSMVLLAFASTIILEDVAAAGPRSNDTANASAKYSLAVLELESSGRVSSSDASRLTERLRSEFGGAGIFEVMSKSELESALQAAELSTMACSTLECALPAGRAAATKLVAFGSVGKTGASYDLFVQLVHIKSGQVVQTVRENFTGDYDALEAHMALVAHRLMGAAGGSAAASSTPSGNMTSPETVTQTPPESSYETTPSESYSDNGERNGNKVLIIGLAAVGLVGGGFLISQALKSDDNNNNNGGNPPPTPGGTLPNPPTFP